MTWKFAWPPRVDVEGHKIIYGWGGMAQLQGTH